MRENFTIEVPSNCDPDHPKYLGPAPDSSHPCHPDFEDFIKERPELVRTIQNSVLRYIEDNQLQGLRNNHTESFTMCSCKCSKMFWVLLIVVILFLITRKK